MMAMMSSMGFLLGSSWASGVNLYLTIAGLGIAHKFDWLILPGKLNSLAHPLIILAAVVLYVIEFFADKIPFVDSVWDSIHTFIRSIGGVALGFMAMADVGPAFQIPVALFTGSVSLDCHLIKATVRAAINTSPEPVCNKFHSQCHRRHFCCWYSSFDCQTSYCRGSFSDLFYLLFNVVSQKDVRISSKGIQSR